MSDDLINADLSQAIVLAGARYEDQQLATLEDPKRKKVPWQDTAGVRSKKGRRLGMRDDKPYKPLPYVDLPVGIEEKEVDQFLREQRLEDLHRKIQARQLEDLEPDLRPPSPPPVFDRAGNRLNSRDVRIRKSMMAEYNRLIRYMQKHIDGYQAPLDFKPQKLMKKIIIPLDKYPQAPFMGVIIGARGVNHKRLQEATGCRIFIRGREMGDKWQSEEEQQMPQHIHVEGDTEEQIEEANRLLEPLLNPETPEFEYARTHGMQQLAVVNGFTVAKFEQRCGVCGAVGHLGFECPETGIQNYRMANVVCAICGDKGHIAQDCKKAAEQHQKENVDWKAEAEKKQQMDAEYADMMNELGKPSSSSNGGLTAVPSIPKPKTFAPPTPGLLSGAEAGKALAKSLGLPESQTSRSWDPATGQYLDEELPPEILEMMKASGPQPLRPKAKGAPLANPCVGNSSPSGPPGQPSGVLSFPPGHPPAATAKGPPAATAKGGAPHDFEQSNRQMMPATPKVPLLSTGLRAPMPSGGLSGESTYGNSQAIVPVSWHKEQSWKEAGSVSWNGSSSSWSGQQGDSASWNGSSSSSWSAQQRGNHSWNGSMDSWSGYQAQNHSWSEASWEAQVPNWKEGSWRDNGLAAMPTPPPWPNDDREFLICPPGLAGKLMGPNGGNLLAMSEETGAQILLDMAAGQPGGKRIIISADTIEAAEKARMHVQAWLAVHTSDWNGSNGSSQPIITNGKMPPHLWKPGMELPEGFPPGMEPEVVGAPSWLPC